MGFSLKGLQADKVPFELEGSTIYFRMVKEFDLQEYAAWQRLNRSLQNIGKQRVKASTDEQHGRVEQKNVNLCREMIALALPDLPGDVLGGFTPGQLDGLAAVCIGVVSGRYGNGGVDAEQVTAVKEIHPDLPRDFVDSLSRKQVAMLLPELEPAGN